jgi:ArsR family transcriptional regulator
MSETIRDTAEIFKALGDENRLKIIKLIASAGNRLCEGMLAHKLGISQSAVSQHLKTLKTAGLVVSERQGVHFHYRVVDDFMAPYGIDTNGFLRSFGAELDTGHYCEYKDKTEQCDRLNE